MTLFGKLIGKKSEPSPSVPANPSTIPTRTAEEYRKDPNYIQVFDSFGREMFVTKEQWRTNSLPGALKLNWNDPDKLYGIIVMALHDGFFADVLNASAHLYRTDPNLSRGATVYGIVLMKVGKLNQAEEVFRSYLKVHGDDGTVLTNLAKLQADHNEKTESENTLWHALEVDPNMENALGWHQAIHRERGGESAEARELERIAALPGSWRAQLWLARAALKTQDYEKALALYRISLSHAGQPVPTDLLVQMSGDLGNHGHLAELLQMAEPEFVPKLHGLLVGNNIIKAHLDLGHIEAASKVLEQLYDLHRPDWKQQLSFWDTAIAKAKIAQSNAGLKVPTESTMLMIDGPVWLKPSSPANSLFPHKYMHEIFISFLGGSVTALRESDQVHLQLSDAPGRLSRSVPLYLAEQVHFHIDIHVQTLLPWIKEERGAFMVSGKIWPDTDAAKYSKIAQPRNQFVVLTHLIAETVDRTTPWQIQLRLIRTGDAECIATLDSSFSPSDPEEGLSGLSKRLVAMLAQQTKTMANKPSTLYQVPSGILFSDYLLRIEQLLATRCAGMESHGPDFLSGTREILDGMLGLCLSCPSNAVVHILLAETILAMKRVRPDVAAEFKEKVQLLQKQNRLADSAQAVVENILEESPQSQQ
jgi:tetratricopeptide (TPR) repeat protein